MLHYYMTVQTACLTLWYYVRQKIHVSESLMLFYEMNIINVVMQDLLHHEHTLM